MAEDGTVGWAIIGCGRVTERRIAPVFAKTDDAELVAFCSRSLARAQLYREQHGAKRAYDSLDALLENDEVRVVYIATPHARHAEQAVACLTAGKHVLVDKPMAINAEAAEKMAEAARSNGRLLGVMQQQRFHPANMHLIRLVDEGQLGKVNILRAQIGIWYPPGDNWRLVPELSGGGVAIDLAPHALDLMLEVAGEVKRVNAATRNLQFSYPVEDFCAARLEFASGAMGLLDLSYCSHYYGGRLEVFGSEGSFTADGSLQQAPVFHTWFRRGDTDERREACSTADCFLAAVEDFTDAVQHHGDPSIGMADGVRVMQVIDAIYASSASGRPVDIPA